MLRTIGRRKAFSDDAVNSPDVSRLEPRDRNLATEIVYGCLRWQLLLDRVLADRSARAWETVESDAALLLRMSLYQFWFLQRVPEFAIVHDAVEIAKGFRRPGLPAFINAILRSLLRDRPWTRPDYLAGLPPWVRVSLPEWLWQRWARRFGAPAAQEYAICLNQPPPRVVCAPGAEDRVPDATPSSLVPGAWILDGGAGGADKLPFQDEASQLVAHILPLVPGLPVWDVCAAPGNKTAILRRRAGFARLVVATDSNMKRTVELRRRVRAESGIPDAAIAVADASQCHWRTRFGAVLVDAPCSGLGTLRRNPEIKWHFRPERFPALRKKQESILQCAAVHVAVGGYLLYSTCSTEPEENEEVVRAFLSSQPSFEIRRPVLMPTLDPRIGPDGYLRTFPGAHGWDGFFAALMQRQH